MPSPRLVDSHVHLNFDVYDSDLEEVATRWRQAGVEQLVHSCVQPSEFAQLRAIADRFPEVFLAVGLHPLDAAIWTPALAQDIAQLAADPRVVAIGETGLDFFKSDPASLELQLTAFQTQLEIARRLDRAVIIHCRDAAEKTREILQAALPQESPSGSLRVVMHCWSGTPTETAWFVELGCFISFSGIVTFKSARSVQESLLVVPDDLLLVETDCPFLAPTPYRGKRNEPAYVAQVAAKVAELRGQDLLTLAELTTRNARRLFHLPGVLC